ncbi:MAG: DUF3524 domain-containing protein [Halioglobus sp.]
MKVLLLSAYAARSHVHWQNSLQTMFPQWQWCVLSLPPRHFSWRVRGNALYWSMSERKTLEDTYDLLIATSMVDLATLRGLVPSLCRIPSALYFHENQFDYPQRRHQHSLVEAQLTSMYSALAANCLLFNSQFNRTSFMEGCTQLLRKLPDYVPRAIVPMLQAKSQVLPVPLDLPKVQLTQPYWPGVIRVDSTHPLRLLWVGRFEHDKGAEGLLRILHLLEGRGLAYELALTGQRFRESPQVFNQIQSAFAHRIVHCGYIESFSQYVALMRGADLVLSTALHEFQGVAVLEAAAQGCVPVVPDRLVYPEIYPDRLRYESNLQDVEREARSAAELILAISQNYSHYQTQIPDCSGFLLHNLAPTYERILLSLARSQDSQ